MLPALSRKERPLQKIMKREEFTKLSNLLYNLKISVSKSNSERKKLK
jgi:hypothetical protein